MTTAASQPNGLHSASAARLLEFITQSAATGVEGRGETGETGERRGREEDVGMGRGLEEWAVGTEGQVMAVLIDQRRL